MSTEFLYSCSISDVYNPNIYNTLATDAFLLAYWWSTWNSTHKTRNLIFLQNPSNIKYSPQRLLVGSRCCSASIYYHKLLCFLPCLSTNLQVICLPFVLVLLQVTAKFHTCHWSSLSLTVCYFIKTFAISFSLPHYSNLLSCSPAVSSSVQFLQGFVAIIIIFLQCALCTLKGCFDRSSLVICLKADFSFFLQHCAYAPLLLQLPGIQHVLQGQFVCSFWFFIPRRADRM